MFFEGTIIGVLNDLADIKCQVLGIPHKKQFMVMNHLKELIQFADNSSVKLTINLLMIFQSMTQKSKEIYLFTINSLSPSHYQKVFKKVGHQNVTDDKAGNVLPLEQNISLLYSVSEVNFYVF